MKLKETKHLKMNKDYIDNWIDIAIKDIQSSRLLYKNKLYSNSFYHFQQASEKGLKAYAFMIKNFTSEKDARSISHNSLKFFKNSATKRQEELLHFKEFGLEKLIDHETLDKYTANLNNELDELPEKEVMLEYSKEVLEQMLLTLKSLNGYSLEFSVDFKNELIDKMDLFFDSIKKLNPEKVEDIKKEFNEIIQNEYEFNEFINYIKTHINNSITEYYYILILYFSNLISHNHNNNSRYPSNNSNPLKYYNLRKPIIKKLPEFTKHLHSALIKLKQWNIIINPISNEKS